MKYFVILFLALGAFAQEDIEDTVSGDPFNPERLQETVEETPEDPEVIEEISPDMPILDGTILYGNTKIAMFSYTKDGGPAFARAEFKQGKPGYMLYANEGKGDEAVFREEENGTIVGYRIGRVDNGEVELVGNDKTAAVTLFSGQKAKRGGTKKASKRPPKKKGPSKKIDNRPKPKPKSKKNDIKKLDQDKKKKDFNRRKPPNRLKPSERKQRLEKLKRKL